MNLISFIWFNNKFISLWNQFRVASLSRIGSSLKNTTNIVLANFDITLISPIRWPWILYKEIIISIFCSISNSEYCMIKISSTFVSSDYSTCIKLENILTSINCYRNWSMRNWLFHVSNVLWNINESMNLTDCFSLIISAIKIVSFIWIVRFLFKWIFFNVLECIVHFSSVASIIFIIFCTINKLLFREWIEFSSVNKLCTFNSSSYWKCPAWATWSLILYRCNSTFFSPVNRVSKFFLNWVKIGNASIFLLFSFISQHFFPLCICKICKFINSNFWCRIWWMSS